MTCVFDRKRPRDEQIQVWAQAYADQIGAWAQRWPHQWYNFHDVWSQHAGPAGRAGVGLDGGPGSRSELAEEPAAT